MGQTGTADLERLPWRWWAPVDRKGPGWEETISSQWPLPQSDGLCSLAHRDRPPTRAARRATVLQALGMLPSPGGGRSPWVCPLPIPLLPAVFRDPPLATAKFLVPTLLPQPPSRCNGAQHNPGPRTSARECPAPKLAALDGTVAWAPNARLRPCDRKFTSQFSARGCRFAQFLKLKLGFSPLPPRILP